MSRALLLPWAIFALLQTRHAEILQTDPHLFAEVRIPVDGGQPSGPALTIEEMQALVRQETQGLATIRHADGSETLEHGDHFRDYTVLRIGTDGQPVFVCVQGEAALKQALRRPATPAKQAQPPAPPKGDR